MKERTYPVGLGPNEEEIVTLQERALVHNRIVASSIRSRCFRIALQELELVIVNCKKAQRLSLEKEKEV
jgi:hypothetical protein